MLVLSACLMITACGTKSPSEIAKTVFEAGCKLDFETVKKHLAEERISDFEEITKRLLANPDRKEKFLLNFKNAEIKIISEEISNDGNSATITAVIKAGNGEDEEEQMHLIKVNGEWKCDSNLW